MNAATKSLNPTIYSFTAWYALLPPITRPHTCNSRTRTYYVTLFSSFRCGLVESLWEHPHPPPRISLALSGRFWFEHRDQCTMLALRALPADGPRVSAMRGEPSRYVHDHGRQRIDTLSQCRKFPMITLRPPSSHGSLPYYSTTYQSVFRTQRKTYMLPGIFDCRGDNEEYPAIGAAHVHEYSLLKT